MIVVRIDCENKLSMRYKPLHHLIYSTLGEPHTSFLTISTKNFVDFLSMRLKSRYSRMGMAQGKRAGEKNIEADGNLVIMICHQN